MIKSYFMKIYKAILQLEHELVVKTTRVGLIMNALSLLKKVKTKEEFAIGLLRGFLVNFLPNKRI